MNQRERIEPIAKKKIDSIIILDFVTFLPCLAHLSLVTAKIMITMLYRIILLIFISFSDIDFCALDN